ncbi:MAG: hypothetical protein NZ898_03435 [Myxococcota bacterium]|nr:hypothetical protein [Myxococcota bacterium]
MLAAVIGWIAASFAVPARAEPDAGADAGSAYCPPDVVECHGEPLDFEWSEAAFEGIDLDTGWVPPDGAIQLRFGLRAAGRTRIAMGTTGALWWPAPIEASLVGRRGGGRLEIDYGLEITARLRFDVEVAGSRYRWEGDIPLPGGIPRDLAASASGTFDPLLLPGASDRPVEVSDATGRIRLLRYDAIGAVVSIPGVGGGVAADVSVRLDARYATDRVEVRTGRVIEREGAASVLSPPTGSIDGFGGSVSVGFGPVGTLEREVWLTVYPTLYLEIVGRRFDYTIATIEARVAAERTEVRFEPRTLHAALPDADVTPLEMDFGPVPVGGRAERFVDVFDDGEAPLRVTAAEPEGPFEVDPLALDVEPHATRRLSVRFAPLHAGPHASTLLLSTNDPDEPLLAVRLRGEGVAVDGGVPDAGADAAPEASGMPGPYRPASAGGCGCRLGRPRSWLVEGTSVVALAFVACARRPRRPRHVRR